MFINRPLLAVALSAALSEITVADNCTHGVYYCGTSLLALGNYFQYIHNALEKAGQPHNDTWIEQSVFYCLVDDVVLFSEYCKNGCLDNGSGKNGSCK
ncbi:hypothetical protein F4777DRAFT_580014 [Nemania sp. FL0916]|nr:hypothetical protein F4777DRAFT_580014 [Nemania sp. FL0916]